MDIGARLQAVRKTKKSLQRLIIGPWIHSGEHLSHAGEAQFTDDAALPTSVRCDEFFAVRDQALIAHATQVDPNGRWFACPLDVQRAHWPTEDFQLARSLVDTELPEDDLFAGVRERVAP